MPKKKKKAWDFKEKILMNGKWCGNGWNRGRRNYVRGRNMLACFRRKVTVRGGL